MSITLSIIGSGNMGQSLIGGLIKKGHPSQQIWTTDPSQEKLNELKASFSVKVTTDNQKAVSESDVVIFAVKPQALASVATELKEIVQAKKPLILSIAAGVRVSSLQTWLGGDLPIVRAMPNTPALINCGATGLYANALVSPDQRLLAESILNAVGITCWVKQEAELDIVTALSGSGPAYFFLIMEALQAAAEQLGLSPEMAALLTQQTALGAAKMAQETNTPLAVLRQQVTSPGGTTERGLAILEDYKLRDILFKTIEAATHRAEELAEILMKTA